MPRGTTTASALRTAGRPAAARDFGASCKTAYEWLALFDAQQPPTTTHASPTPARPEPAPTASGPSPTPATSTAAGPAGEPVRIEEAGGCVAVFYCSKEVRRIPLNNPHARVLCKRVQRHPCP